MAPLAIVVAAGFFLLGCASVDDVVPGKVCRFRDCVILERMPAACGPWVWGTDDDADLYIAADDFGSVEWDCRKTTAPTR